MSDNTIDLSKMVSLCKQRGFIFQSSEVYGGMSACWDYGPLGVELKNNVKNIWWNEMVSKRENIVGMDGSILMHPQVWVASGHVDSFHDPMQDCKECKKRFRVDNLEVDAKECPDCGGELTGARNFNLMFQTHVGPVEDSSGIAYLRPETAQAIFVNFKNIQQSQRLRCPFGIAQIGKAFRNEIITQRFTFRSLEFEQMEMQFFVPPDEDEKWFEYWMTERKNYYSQLGIRQEKLRFTEHGPNELAHYAKAAFDVEYEFPFGWQEIEGIHNRNDFDLTQHTKHSGKDFTYRDDLTGEKYLPKIIETSSGLDRSILAILFDAYYEEVEEGEGHKRETRNVLRFHPKVAPITAAVFPLMKKPPLLEVSKRLDEDLRNEGFSTKHDQVGSIGKRYRRQDEIGTPWCITIDYDSLDDNKATVRDRDTLKQERVSLDQIGNYLREQIKNY